MYLVSVDPMDRSQEALLGKKGKMSYVKSVLSTEKKYYLYNI